MHHLTNKWLIIATWNFSLPGITEAASLLSKNGTAADAVEKTAVTAEDDPSITSVGYSGFPNREGEVELDAAFMDGTTMEIGAVAALRNYKNPVSIARKIMREIDHNLLVADGASDYAKAHHFTRQCMLSPEAKKAWEEKRLEMAEQNKEVKQIGHDTIGIAALDLYQQMAVCTSTSGIGMKHRGRVGDSPLAGPGFYADDQVGSAAATGVGEEIMKGCTSFLAIELMRQGLPPQQAAEEAVRRTHNRAFQPGRKVGNIALVCVDKQGRYGAAANHDTFTASVAAENISPCVITIKPVEGLKGQLASGEREIVMS